LSRLRIALVPLLYAGAVGLYLVSFARYFDPVYGFTSLIQFALVPEEEIAAVRNVPHPRYVGAGGYDGQFYAQLAVDPLLRDPAIDRALDNPPYRARRILFSWTAWMAGLGRPAWILQAYAVQNAIAWLLLAWLLARWLPPTSLENFAAWFGCLFGHGLLISTRLALLDGPSALVIAAAVTAVAAGRHWLGAALVGVSGLARETNLMAGVALAPVRRIGIRDAARLSLQAVLVVAPLAIWLDYLRSIYRGATLAGDGHLVVPFTAYMQAWSVALRAVAKSGWAGYGRFNLLILVALTTQVVWLIVSVRRWRDPWWRVGLAYAALMLTVHSVVWEGYPGAITRIVLPLTLAFNLLLPRGRWFWPLVVLGNLTVIPGLFFFEVPGVGWL
jgi:hypothetical protein